MTGMRGNRVPLVEGYRFPGNETLTVDSPTEVPFFFVVIIVTRGSERWPLLIALKKFSGDR